MAGFCDRCKSGIKDVMKRSGHGEKGLGNGETLLRAEGRRKDALLKSDLC